MKKLILFACLVVGGVVIATVLLRQPATKTTANEDQITKTSQHTGSSMGVATSFYPLYFFSSVIGGDKVSVTNITPAGAEPHDYEPTAQDIVMIQNSKILILNGNVEPWAEKVKNNLAGKNVSIIVAGDELFTQTISEGGAVSPDPHIWLNPQLAKQEVLRILLAFQAADPSNSAYYATNANILSQKLDQLDAEFKTALSSCQQKDIVTSHDAFGYLASAYGLNQVAISGLSPDEEPSPRELVEVAKFARSKNIQYIFFESLVSPKLSETIAAEIGAKTLVLDPLEGISDADIKQGKDYFSVMRKNLSNLKIALQCTP